MKFISSIVLLIAFQLISSKVRSSGGDTVKNIGVILTGQNAESQAISRGGRDATAAAISGNIAGSYIGQSGEN